MSSQLLQYSTETVQDQIKAISLCCVVDEAVEK